MVKLSTECSALALITTLSVSGLVRVKLWLVKNIYIY